MGVDRRSWCFWLSWMGLCVSAFSAPAPAGPTVTLYYTERPPFAIVEGQTGIVLDRAKAVLAEAGLRGRFIELPQDRITSLLRAGPVDALALGWQRTADREEWGRFSPPLSQDQSPVVVLSARLGSPFGSPVRLEALLAAGLTLGTKAGSPLPPSLERQVRAQGLLPLETTVDVPGLLKMIAGGRMDFTFLPEEEVRYLLGRDPALASGLTWDRLADPPAGEFRRFFFPGSFDPALAARLEAALEKLRL